MMCGNSMAVVDGYGLNKEGKEVGLGLTCVFIKKDELG